jgi:hypothetical protein
VTATSISGFLTELEHVVGNETALSCVLLVNERHPLTRSFDPPEPFAPDACAHERDFMRQSGELA